MIEQGIAVEFVDDSQQEPEMNTLDEPTAE
jgi:hypothetical protein